MANKRIKFIANVLQNFKNDKFIDDVNKIYTSPDIFEMKHNGEKNKGSVIYRIDRPDWQCGFFANFNHILAQFYMCDKYGFKPVVAIGENWPYYEKDGINGTKNGWEYYFKQPVGVEFSDADESAAVIDYQNVYFERYYPIFVKNGYEYPDEYYSEMGRVFKNYVHYNDVTLARLNSDIISIIGNRKTLGVQIRMGDMLLAPNGHPVVPELDEYVVEIKKALEIGGFEQIYLATDDDRAVNRLKEEFGDRVKFYDDVSRVNGIYSAYNIPTERKNHRYLCGLEVIRDMQTLASCDGLVAGMSQVVIASRIAKAASGKNWDYIHIIDKGVHHNDKACLGKEAEAIMNAEIAREHGNKK